MSALHLVIHGRVQGVGYRNWLLGTARTLGLKGWVRNLVDGRVEAVIAGPEAALRTCLAACREGPPLAQVSRIENTACPMPDMNGFEKKPTEAQ